MRQGCLAVMIRADHFRINTTSRGTDSRRDQTPESAQKHWKKKCTIHDSCFTNLTWRDRYTKSGQASHGSFSAEWKPNIAMKHVVPIPLESAIAQHALAKPATALSLRPFSVVCSIPQ
jgi:hypothetical protein